MSEFSVVIPTFNGARFLGDQLLALMQQDYQGEWELIIADNGSTDDTAAVARRFAEGLPLQLVDASERRGPAFARNVGVRASNGKVILFLDDDDIVASDWLSKMVEVFAEGRVDVIAGGVSFDFENQDPHATHEQETSFLPYGMGANLGIRRNVFDELGGFDLEFFACQDVEICWRAQVQGYSFERHPAAVIFKRKRVNLRSIWRQHFRYGRAHAKLFACYSRHGMSRDWRQASKTWAWLVTRFPLALYRRDLSPLARPLAHSVGRMVGSLENRVLYP